jgi:hypothetical protein
MWAAGEIARAGWPANMDTVTHVAAEINKHAMSARRDVLFIEQLLSNDE